MKLLTSAAIAALAVAFAAPAHADTERYSVIFGGKDVGHLNADATPRRGDDRLRHQEQRPRADDEGDDQARRRRPADRVGRRLAPPPSAARCRNASARTGQARDLDRFDRQGQGARRTGGALRRAERQPVVDRPLCARDPEGGRHHAAGAARRHADGWRRARRCRVDRQGRRRCRSRATTSPASTPRPTPCCSTPMAQLFASVSPRPGGRARRLRGRGRAAADARRRLDHASVSRRSRRRSRTTTTRRCASATCACSIRRRRR